MTLEKCTAVDRLVASLIAVASWQNPKMTPEKYTTMTCAEGKRRKEPQTRAQEAMTK
jgi:hypothetical protein